MHGSISDKALKSDSRTGETSTDTRPTRCNRFGCLERHRFHRHSRYPRKSVYRNGVGWSPALWVQRYRCAACEKVFSLILPFVYKWQRADHALQQAVALEQPYDRDAVDAAFSRRTLQRWKQKWQARCGTYLQAILAWLLTRHAGSVSVDVTRRQSRTPLGYLHALLAQVPGQVPNAVDVVCVCRFGGWPLQRIPHSLSLVFD